MTSKLARSSSTSNEKIRPPYDQKQFSDLQTKCKTLEEKLEAAQAESSLIFDKVGQAIRIIDTNYRICRINQAFTTMSGISINDAVGKKCWEVFPSAACRTSECQLSRILGGENVIQTEIDRPRKDSSAAPYLVSAFALRSSNGEIVGIMESFIDFTERNKVRESLHRQNTLLNSLINSNPNFLIFSLDNNYCYTAFNEHHKNEMRRIWNIDINEGMNILDCMTDERLRLLAKKSMDRVLRGEAFTEVQHQEPKDIYYEFNWNPIRQQDSTIMGVTSIVRDITELKKAQDQVREFESRYQALIHLGTEAGEAIVMLQDINGLEGAQTFFNDQWLLITGYQREELLGMPFFLLVSPKDRASSIDRHRQKMAGNSVPGLYEMSIIRKNETQIPIEITGAFTTYHGKRANVVYIRDITQRKQAELALWQSEKLYRTVFESTGTAMSIVEASGTISLVNKEWERLYGYSSTDAIGLHISKLVAPEARGLVQSYHEARMLNAESVPGVYESRIVDKNGKVKDVLFTINMVPGTNNRVVSTLDLTERKQDEKQLRLYKDHLEKLVDKRTMELRNSMKLIKNAERNLKLLYSSEQMLRKKLEKQMGQRVEFTRALVHELKTPLTPLLGATDLLSAKLKDEPWLSLAVQAYKGAVDLNKRMDELFDLTRSEIGRLKLSYNQVDLRKLIEDLVIYMQPLFADSEHKLELHLPKSLPFLCCDQDRLRQILMNLLDNAARHTPRGTIISLVCQQKNAYMLFRVQDTGLGISKDILRRVFKPYYRIETDREIFSGLGLGLALCKTFVELHGGRIWARSTPGKGSSFSFTIPTNITKTKGGGKLESLDY